MQLISCLLLLVNCALIVQNVSAVYLVNWWHAPPGFGHIKEVISSIRVPKGSDPTHTYWAANGFFGGYMGMQHNAGTERRILFSIWDDGKGGKVDLLQLGPGGEDGGFGGEGTGRHTITHYNWKPEQTVFFRMTAEVNQAGNYSDYAGYWNVGGPWTLIAKYRAHNVLKYLDGSYSFLENWTKTDKNVIREGFYGNQTIINTQGQKTRAKVVYEAQSTSPGDIWGERIVNGESYLRMDGPKNQGRYPPNHSS
ncbi:hypothetical protein [Absidia glauca]|uniref:Uncharacterized protein n=1 Tax=Absidia glauca TaxID=4829 RepID=A0A168PWG6_ABSGL|nr:hypothetical protein [Absidia glauca]